MDERVLTAGKPRGIARLHMDHLTEAGLRQPAEVVRIKVLLDLLQLVVIQRGSAIARAGEALQLLPREQAVGVGVEVGEDLVEHRLQLRREPVAAEERGAAAVRSAFGQARIPTVQGERSCGS